MSTGGCAVFGPRTPPRLRRGVSCIAGGTGLGGVPPPRVYRGVRRLRASHPPALAVEGLLLCRWARFVVLGVGARRVCKQAILAQVTLPAQGPSARISPLRLKFLSFGRGWQPGGALQLFHLRRWRAMLATDAGRAARVLRSGTELPLRQRGETEQIAGMAARVPRPGTEPPLQQDAGRAARVPRSGTELPLRQRGLERSTLIYVLRSWTRLEALAARGPARR